MIKGKEILGRNIVAIDNGEKIDTVRDVVFDHQGNQVLAFLVDEGGWFRAAKAIPFDRVRSIGEHAIMVGSADDVTSSRDDKRLGDALESKTSLLGMTLLTTDGQNLGRIADVYFDEHTGAVVGYEATGGLFADLSSGRAFIPAPSDVQIGADAAIVPLSVAAAMKENPGGIRGAFKSAGDAVTGAVHSASEAVTGAVQNAGEAVKETYQNATESVKDATQQASEAATERQQQYVIGKTSNTEIIAEDGTVIVHKGEVVTPLHAEVAEWHGKLPALAAAVTGASVAESVGQATESFTSKMSSGFQGLLGEARRRQKEFVVGKPAGTDVTLEDGTVLVHKGDTITAHQADQAEQAGSLAALTAAATAGAVTGAGQSDQPAPVFTAQDAIGRRVQADVRAEGGSLLAVQGQIVTPEILARARTLGLEKELVAATQDSSATAGAGAAVATGVDRVTEGASNLLNKAKNWFSDRREETEQAIQDRQQEQHEQHIREALGRPVNRVVLAPDDSIILNVGEVVTNKAVEAARAAGVLDILLSSVSPDAPSIDPLASRPAETGQAALDSQAEVKPESQG